VCVCVCARACVSVCARERLCVTIPMFCRRACRYSKLLRTFAFIIGLGDPIISPTPIEGLHVGAAFLNPVGKEGYYPPNYNKAYGQHSALAHLGSPYVYNYPYGDGAAAVEAAEKAVALRFASYVPAPFHVESVVAQVCAAMSDDAPCTCAHANKSVLECGHGTPPFPGYAVVLP
jgi:hypothetical protein